MKIKKLVKVTAKSDYMDVETIMTSAKAVGYVKKLKKIHQLQLDALKVESQTRYRVGCLLKTRTVRELPEDKKTKLTVNIETVGEILD